MSTVSAVDARLKRDPDYRAAWRACRKPMGTGVPGSKWRPADPIIDLRVRLTASLKAGWSPAALKALAWSEWRTPHYDHVTPAAWRWAVWAASESVKGGIDLTGGFLEYFNADPTRYAECVK